MGIRSDLTFRSNAQDKMMQLQWHNAIQTTYAALHAVYVEMYEANVVLGINHRLHGQSYH